jgi:hypothetical protein
MGTVATTFKLKASIQILRRYNVHTSRANTVSVIHEVLRIDTDCMALNWLFL